MGTSQGPVRDVPCQGRRVASCALLLALAVFVTSGALHAAPRSRARVTAGGHVFTVDVADTPALQTRGLGGRARLGTSEGMLFPYAEKLRHVFWMKDMLISIDMIWLDNRRIVHIEHRVPPPQPGTPDSELPSYYPPLPANFVLELAAGRARALNLKEGDLVDYDFGGAGR